MKARFIGDPNDNGSGPEVFNAFGFVFPKSKWVGIDDVSEEVLKRLANNNHFEVNNGDAKAVTSVKELEEKASKVEIPTDWRSQHHSTRMKLAKELGAEDITTADQADEYIAQALGEDVDDGFSELDPE